jgi:uncharacterized protein (TIGR02996 family)
MNQGDALLAAILDNPADDGPRLVYADWLEETGGQAERERAEFIRVQVALARAEAVEGRPEPGPGLAGWLLGLHRETQTVRAFMGLTGCDCEAYLRQREKELLRMHGTDWFRADRGMAPGAPVERNAWSFRPTASMMPARYWLGYKRGLLGRYDGSLADWLDHGPAIVRAYPMQRVELIDRQPCDRVADGVSWVDRLGPRADPPIAPQYLPSDLFALLDGYDDDEGMLATVRVYHSEQAARDALSAACLRLAREQPLPT